MIRSSRFGLMTLGIVASLVTLSTTPQTASAQYVWTGANGFPNVINDPFNWSNPYNWQGNSIPPSNAATSITFAAAPSGVSNNNLGSPFVLNYLTFSTGVTATGGQLDFRTTASSAQITQNTVASVTVANPLLINTPFLMTGSGGMVTLSGAITGSGSFTQGFAPNSTSGNYVTELTSGANTYGGSTFVHSGTLRPTVAGALPTGRDVTVTAGTLDLANNISHTIGSLTLSRGDTTGTSPAPVVTGGGTLTLNGNIVYTPNSNGISRGGRIDPNIDLGSTTRTINVVAASSGIYDLVIGGQILGGAGIQKAGIGNLALTRSASYTGSTGVSGGILYLGSTNTLPTATAVSLIGGGLQLNPLFTASGVTPGNYNQTIGSLAGSSSTLSLGSATLTVGTDNTSTSYSGTITGGGGSLVKVGTGTLVLGGNNSFGGGLTVTAGTLGVTTDAALGTSANSIALSPFGTLAYTETTSTARTFDLSSGTLAIAAGKTLTFSNATVGNGYLTGPGTFLTSGFRTNFAGGSTASSVQLVLNASDTVTNYNLSGQTTVLNTFPVAFNRVTNTTSGRLEVQAGAILNVSEFTSTGVLTVIGGATPGRINNTGADVYLGGGSRTYVGANVTGQRNGTINLGGRAMEVNGGLLVNNGNFVSSGTGGIQNGTVNVNYGGLAKGTGYYDAVNVTDGGRFAPGNSITNTTSGSLTLGSGGAYEFEINRAGGTAGGGGTTPPVGWDLLNLNTAFTVNSTAASPAAIQLVSRNAADTGGGSLPDFNSGQSYQWLAFHVNAGGTVNGFSPDKFTFDTSMFSNLPNPTGVGTFALFQSGNDIFVTYTPVPEPGAVLAIAATGVWGLSLVRRARRQDKRDRHQLYVAQ